YISGHPLSEFKDILDTMNTTLELRGLKVSESESEHGPMAMDSELADGSPFTIGGIIVSKKLKTTRNDEIMAFITLEDLYGSVEVIVFPSTYEKYRPLLEEDSAVIINGRLSLREDEDPKIILDEVRPLVRTSKNKRLYLKIEKGSRIDIDRQICPILRRYHGNIPVYLFIESTGKKFLANRDLWVEGHPELLKVLSDVLGQNCVKLIG
ncbi:MAG: OB-fold nucleic acid binding domain-containing protein, partial [Caldicoprobacter sp.]|uniref:OB-fold nucleic acid binding domain-containing protein n=1 Tax=Caldicoprobacter sp. TaxID=2004500 RepID=UPI0039C05014